MRLLLDEHYSAAIAEQLRARGLDVTTVAALGLEGTDDEPLLQIAVADRRALLTNNVVDFATLHTRWMADGRTHHGLLFTDDARLPRSRSTIGRYVAALAAFMEPRPGDDAIVDQIHWLR